MAVEMAAVAAVRTNSDSVHNMLERDVRLIRPALLYADKITLTSITAKMIVDRDHIEYTPIAERLDLAIRASIEAKDWPLKRFTIKEVIETRDALAAFQGRTRSLLSFDEKALLSRIQEQMFLIIQELNRYWDEFVVSNFADVKNSSGYSELDLAIQAGILIINPLNDGESGMETAEHYLDILGETLGNPHVYPLIDEQLSDVIEKGFNSGRFKSYGLLQGRASQAAAGTEFIESLPAFPRARVGDLLDLREAIKDNRAAYQSEVARIAESITSEAFSRDMTAQIQDEYVRVVQPILRDLEQQMLDKRFRRIVRTNVLSQAGSIGAATLRSIVGLGMGIGQLTGIMDTPPVLDQYHADMVLGTLSTAVGAQPVRSVLDALGRSINESESARTKVERHGLYYLLQAQNQLGKNQQESWGHWSAALREF